MKMSLRNSDEIYAELKATMREQVVRRQELAQELSTALHKEFPDKKK